ncbi:MAG: flagellar basal body-associated FliL family protein [Rhodobacteraceae bacterium]|nr:flagellar basal body-associated FliL family protein [Paracoccaceae bacterium]
MGKLLPVILAVIGLGAGVGAGIFLRPDPQAEDHGAEAGDHAAAIDCPTPGPDLAMADDHGHGGAAGPELLTEFVKFSNQFVVPVMGDDNVQAMVVLTLSIEVSEGAKEAIYNREPKLRDAFLRVLFDHANAGGFNGNFLNSAGLDTLRSALRETAFTTAGPIVRDVLIVDLVKQQV